MFGIAKKDGKHSAQKIHHLKLQAYKAIVKYVIARHQCCTYKVSDVSGSGSTMEVEVHRVRHMIDIIN